MRCRVEMLFEYNFWETWERVMRERPTDRQESIQYNVRHVFTVGKDVKVLCTASFATLASGTLQAPARVVAIFCADFKAGTDYHGLVTDASVLASLALQGGNSLEEVCDKMVRDPPSLIGDVLRGALDVERSVRRDRGEQT